MPLHPKLAEITDRIIERSADTRSAYLNRIDAAAGDGPHRAHLSCGNQAHAYAAMKEKSALVSGRVPNLGIISAYNDMLSAHQPIDEFPSI